jgi:hypothetical protein
MTNNAYIENQKNKWSLSDRHKRCFSDEEGMAPDCYLGAVELFDAYLSKNPRESYLENWLAASMCALLSIKHEYCELERYMVFFNVFDPTDS